MTDYDPGNIFARILRNEVPSARVYEDDEFVAFKDIAPKAPVHILVIPRHEGTTAPSALLESDAGWMGRMVVAATKIARAEGLDERGYRLVMNSGPDAHQEVQHIHLHILGGKSLDSMA
ncbi:MAG: histidine triad nucleotide-binding protein [Dehalococcoidia bacterium]|nr:histidine triad nucleotide-binding protein [Dehalococcoidia bacterium]HRC62191.1 histidine triad nucleotide-binding protein [Dehalococcoidia bacterium]